MHNALCSYRGCYDANKPQHTTSKELNKLNTPIIISVNCCNTNLS